MRTATSLLACLLWLSAATYAQDDHQEQMKANLEQKLAKPFVKNAAWELDYDKALEKAKAENKVIFAYFTRSYAP